MSFASFAKQHIPRYQPPKRAIDDGGLSGIFYLLDTDNKVYEYKYRLKFVPGNPKEVYWKLSHKPEWSPYSTSFSIFISERQARERGLI